ncbi:hypothetical protein [Duganella sp. CF458]|uniref:hypothetical protein n=1 Tax=Duganella sp. CF458 TaxID=1884368 RepID=UPI000B8443EC|nr:hypothetical protein [Duganella sp. CF458]
MNQMTFPTLDSARSARDGGIDAMAALDKAVREVLVGLSDADQKKIKLAFGEVMGEVVEKLINPAIRAFPELDLDQTTWTAIARARAVARANAV